MGSNRRKMILLVPHVCRVSTITSHDVRRRYHFNLNLL
nr:MAG TPA: hypothetical protein [Caudoviricetes sp.]